VGQPTKADRACAVAAAAAHDLNNELTVILNSVAASLKMLERGHPANELLLDIRRAAQRCVWRASGLLNYSARRGVRTVRTPFDRLVDK
jgi:signal transduction histidine kinase